MELYFLGDGREHLGKRCAACLIAGGSRLAAFSGERQALTLEQIDTITSALPTSEHLRDLLGVHAQIYFALCLELRNLRLLRTNLRILTSGTEQRESDAELEREHVGEGVTSLGVRQSRAPVRTLLCACERNLGSSDVDLRIEGEQGSDFNAERLNRIVD